jgi:hypothetical protein
MSFQDSELSVNDYFRGADLSAIAPQKKPREPMISSFPTVKEAIAYAQKLREYPKALEEWHAEIAPIQAQIKARHNEFYLYFLEKVGISPDHPKAKKLYDLCWREEHSNGYQEVLNYGYDLSELLR